MSHQSDNSEWVTIAVYNQPYNAQLARSALEADGMETMLVGEHHASVQWLYTQALGGIQLRVPQRDVQRAAELLEAALDRNGSKPKCPQCGNEDIRTGKLPLLAAVSSYLLLGIPFLFLKSPRHCGGCGHRWPPDSD